MKRHKRGDKVVILGSGPRARVEKIAACRCGVEDERGPRSVEYRDEWWTEHLASAATGEEE